MPAHKVGEPRPRMAGPLVDFDEKVRAIITGCRGRANAISTAKIAGRILSEEYTHFAGSPRYVASVRRAVASSVRNLRRLSRNEELGLKIGSARGGKGGPPGYFTIVSMEDLQATLGPLRSQAIDELTTIARLAPPEYRAKLAGQVRLILEA